MSFNVGDTREDGYWQGWLSGGFQLDGIADFQDDDLPTPAHL